MLTSTVSGEKAKQEAKSTIFVADRIGWHVLQEAHLKYNP